MMMAANSALSDMQWQPHHAQLPIRTASRPRPFSLYAG